MVEGGRWFLFIILGLIGASMLIVGVAEISGLTGETVRGPEPLPIVRAAGFKDIVMGIAYLLSAAGIFKWNRYGRILAIALAGYNLVGALLSFEVIWLAAAAMALAWLFHPAVSRRFSEAHSATSS